MQIRGPLINTISALFGNGSVPSIYGTENATYTPGGPAGVVYEAPRLDLVLPANIVDVYVPYSGSRNGRGGDCVNHEDLASGDQMHTFLMGFFIPPQALERVFRAAAYISHDIWFSGTGKALTVEHDAGQDMQKPGLGDRSVIGLTIAIAIFLLSLLLLAFYARFSKTWTSSLDAYALLRIGAELGKEALPFLVVQDTHHIGELDELLGWVGDVMEARQVKPVKTAARYLSYPELPRRTMFDTFCHYCSVVCGLGGLRRMRAGQKVREARIWLRSCCVAK